MASWIISVLITWFIAAVGLWLSAKLVPGVNIDGFKSAFWVAIVFACLNALLGWFFWTILTLASLGLALLLAFITRLVINAIILKLTASITDSFRIEGFLPAVIASLVISITTSVFEYLFQMGG